MRADLTITQFAKLSATFIFLANVAVAQNGEIFNDPNGNTFQNFNGTWYNINASGDTLFRVDPTKIMVKFADGATPQQIQNLLLSTNTFVVNIIEPIEVYVIGLNSPADLINVINTFNQSGFTLFAEMEILGRYTGVPNDPLFPQMWHLAQQNDADIDAPEAWDIETGSTKVVVGILDSGTDWLHPDLDANIYKNPGEDDWSDPSDPTSGNNIDDDGNGYVDDWIGWHVGDNTNNTRFTSRPGFPGVNDMFSHGTGVAGVVAAETNNGMGVAGVAGGNNGSGVQMAIVSMGNAPSSSKITEGIAYLVQLGVDIIQISSEIASGTGVELAVGLAKASNVLVFCAAGNSNSTPIAYPASIDYVFSVGATIQDDTKRVLSKFGVQLDITAPGEDIWTTDALDNDYRLWFGTSFSCPMVSGTAALLWSINRCLTVDEVKTILRESADKVGGYNYNYDINKPGHSLELGYGRLNVQRAVERAATYRVPAGTVDSKNTIKARNIIVEQGAILTVTGEALLSDGGKVIIEPNATLRLFGKITGCDDDLFHGIIEVKEGGKLRLFPGSEVRLAGDELSGKEGLLLVRGSANGQSGELFYSPSATILLNDDNTVLEVKGKLSIVGTADFGFQGNGFVRFSQPGFRSHNISAGTNASMTFAGASPVDKVLEITQETMLTPSNLSRLTISNGTVLMGTNSRLSVDVPLTFTSVRMSSVAGGFNGHRGLVTYGQKDAMVSGAVIRDGETGITALMSFTDGAPLTISNSSVLQCNVGLLTCDKGVTLNNVTLSNNFTLGWMATGMSFPSTATNSSMNDNGLGGLNYDGAAGSSLFMDRCNVNDNPNGGLSVNGTVTASIRCGTINNNDVGISLTNKATLNMSSQQTPAAGGVDARNNGTTIKPDVAGGLLLNIGNNNLVPSSGGFSVNGTVLLQCFTEKIDANNNSWNTANKQPSSLKDYNLRNADNLCNKPIFIEDNKPLANLPPECGIIEPPGPGGSQALKNSDPLNFCPDCEKISTEDFAGVSLNEAVKIAIAMMEQVDSAGGDDFEAIDLFRQILTFGYRIKQESERWLLDLAYAKMKEALVNTFFTGKLTGQDNVPDLHPAVEDVISTQDFLIAEVRSEGESLLEFYLTADKSQVFRLIDQRTRALEILDDIGECVALDSMQFSFLSHWRRLIFAESLVLDGSVPKEDFVDLLNNKSDAFISASGINIRDGHDTLPLIRCVGDSLRFSPSRFSDSYSWDFGDGSTSSESEPVHVYQAPGIYCLTLMQQFSCTAKTHTVKVIILPALESELESALAGCPGEVLVGFRLSSDFADLAPPDTASGCGYTPLDTSLLRVLNAWSFSGNCPDTTTTGFSDAQSCTFSAGGEFIVSVTATLQFLDTATNTWITTLCSNTLSDTVIIPESLDASFTFEPFECIRDSIRFINTTAGGSPDSLLQFAWDFGDGEESDERNPTHLYEEAGTYTITLLAGDGLTGCIDTFFTDITVPLCPFGVVFNNAACGGGPAPGVTIAPAFVMDGDTVISENEDFAALTDENGVFSYSAETLEEIADEAGGEPVSFATVNGLDFEDAEFKTIAEWLDDAPGEFTLASHSLDWAARYGDLPAPGATQDTIRMRVATAIDANRNVYVTGFAAADPGLSVGSFGFVTIKYSPRGEVLWASELVPDVSSGRGAVPLAIAVNSLGEAYVAGFLSETSGQSDMLVVKYDSMGNQAAAETFSAGSGVNQAVAIALDAAGNIYVTGEGAEDIITIKYDADLDEQWSASYDGPGGGRDAANAIALRDGSVYVAGVSTGAGTNSDMVTIKYSDNGDEEWDERYNGSANLADGAVGVGTDPEGNVFVTGISAETGTGFGMTTIKYDSEGDMLWNKHFRTPGNDFDQPRGLATDNSGNVYIAGVTGTGITLLPTNTLQVDAAAFDFDVVTLKYDADGGLLWDETYDGPIAGDLDVPNDIIADAAGNVYVTGVTQGTSDNNSAFSFGFGVETTFINIIIGGSAWITIAIVPEPPVSVGSGPGDNILTIRYDTDGNTVWAESFDSPEGAQDGAFGIAQDEAGDVYVTGFSALLNPGPFSVGVRFTTLKYAQCGDIAVTGVAKIAGPPPIVTEEKEPAAQELEMLNRASLAIYPNPAKDGTINIAFRLEMDEVVTFDIMDMSGRVLVSVAQDAPMKEGTYVIPVSTTSLHNGLYLARLRTGTALAVQRVAIMR